MSPSPKPFRTHSEQIELLKKRGLSFNDQAKAKEILARENYFNLINGYKDMFLSSPDQEKYIPGSLFSEIYALYRFDRSIRHHFLAEILRIENHAKSLISHQFAQKYGTKDYLKTENFNSIPFNEPKIEKLFNDIEKDIRDKKTKHQAISHYLNKHGFVPPWVLVNILTFGRISTWYSLLKDDDKSEVAKVFNLKGNELNSFLRVLSLARNICAHDERLYCHRFREYIPNTSYHEKVSGVNAFGQYNKGKRDCLAILIALKVLIYQDEFDSLAVKIAAEIETLKTSLHTINSNDVLIKMGFPKNWRRLQKA